MPAFAQRLSPLVLPALIVALTAALISSPLMARVASVLPAAPLVALALAALLAWRFMRQRTVQLSLLLAAAHVPLLVPGLAITGPAAVALLSVLVPLAALSVLWMPERPLLSPLGVLRMALALAPLAAFSADWGAASQAALAGVALPAPLDALPGLPLYGAAIVAQVAVSVRQRSVLPAAGAGALATSALALAAPDPVVAAAWLGGAGLALVLGVVQASFRMAFLDKLTGLPGRRAFDEHLARLGGRYAIAMVDVDHFKRFNDTWGHDVGDDALAKVGAQLGRVGGGGRAYRYGGEEFALVFDGRSAEAVFERVDGLRAAIEADPLIIRGGDRPKRARAGKKKRSGAARPKAKKVHLTVSVGLSESPGGRGAPAPEAVVKQADKSLYKAKKKGRNQVVVG